MRKYIKFITLHVAKFQKLSAFINVVNFGYYLYTANHSQPMVNEAEFTVFTIGICVHLLLWELPAFIAKRFYRSEKYSAQYNKLFSQFFSDADIPLEHKHEYFETYSEMERRDILDSYEHNIKMCDEIIRKKIYSPRKKTAKSKGGKCAQ